ncbi:thioredoxin family protein [Hathewaya histolytica]|uniref:Thioredoxin n=1 Tax=Hathewaya histolytica TaxID=1498 RepID=A0A4U9R3B3_HATHI|nr:thioredoxin family protein [Hathewaya histolytica]VTQ85078.1 thioredoxin [Hathewaya histolytica]
MLELNKENWEQEVTNCTEKPVFVDFWGDKCEICKQLMPGVHGLEEKYGDKIKFASLNTSGSRRLAIAQRVLGLPTMKIYKDGEPVATITPDKIATLDDIEGFIKEYYETL